MTPKAPVHLYKPVGEFKERIMITNVKEFRKKTNDYYTLLFPLLALTAFVYGYTVVFGFTH